MAQESLCYEKKRNISGNLSIIGSDTLSNLVASWGRRFKDDYPNINIQIQTSGSTAAVPALIEATAQLGLMSRSMREREKQLFEKKYGYPPTQIKVAIDAIGIFVHQDNPLEKISLMSLDALYSQTLYCGAVEHIDQWGQLGLKGTWQKRDIRIFGRNSASGTYGLFKDDVLCDGDFRMGISVLPGGASVVQFVSNTLHAIGYAGIGYSTADAKLIPLDIEGKTIHATNENIISGRYPLSRYLYIYVNKEKTKPLSDKEAQFIKFILSSQGQAMVAAEGFIPLPHDLIYKQLVSLGLE